MQRRLTGSFATLDRSAVNQLRTAMYLVDEGSEVLVGYDAASGKTYPAQEGEEPGSVAFSDELLADLGDPGRRIVLHHNHPSGTSLSATDLRQIGALPGLHQLCVHGENGAFYWAERIDGFDAWDVARLESVARKAFLAAFQREAIDRDGGRALYHHIACEAFAACGFIRYGATLSPAAGEAYVSHQEAITALIAEIRAGTKP